MYDELKLEKSRRTVWNFAKAATLDENAADDITQDVFVEALKNKDLFETSESPLGLLMTITKHKTKEYFRKRRFFLPFDFALYEKPTSPLIEDVIKNEDSREMHEAIDSLPDVYGRIVILHYYYDMSLKEIAAMTGENYNTLMWRNRKALKMLKIKLNGNYVGPDTSRGRQRISIKTFLLLCEVRLWANIETLLKNDYVSLYALQ